MKRARALLLTLGLAFTADAAPWKLKAGESLRHTFPHLTRLQWLDNGVVELCVGEAGELHLTGLHAGVTQLVVTAGAQRTELEVEVSASDERTADDWWPQPAQWRELDTGTR
jgi:hypothetical protein